MLHAAAGLANQVVPPLTPGPGNAPGRDGLVGPLDNLPGCTLPPPGLVGWWQAEGNANDVLAQHNGTLHGGVAFVSGEVGYGFSFNGSSGYVGVDDSGSLELTSALTIECWVRRSNLANEDYLINKGGDYTWGALNYGLTFNSSPVGQRFNVHVRQRLPPLGQHRRLQLAPHRRGGHQRPDRPELLRGWSGPAGHRARRGWNDQPVSFPQAAADRGASGSG